MLDHAELYCIIYSTLKNRLVHPDCFLSQERSKIFHLYPSYGRFLMEDFGGKRACGGFVTLNEHSIITQNVSASLKTENLRPQWMKMA